MTAGCPATGSMLLSLRNGAHPEVAVTSHITSREQLTDPAADRTGRFLFKRCEDIDAPLPALQHRSILEIRENTGATRHDAQTAFLLRYQVGLYAHYVVLAGIGKHVRDKFHLHIFKLFAF